MCPICSSFSAYSRGPVPRKASEVTAFGRRVAAGRVLAGLSHAELARALNMSEKTLQRLLAGKREIKDKEMVALQEALGVPDWFLRNGLRPGRPNDRDGTDVDRRRHDEIRTRLSAIEEQLRELSRREAPSRRSP